MIISIGVVFLWRRSILVYEKRENNSWRILLGVNLFVTITCLIISINLLSFDENEKEQIEKDKIENIKKNEN